MGLSQDYGRTWQQSKHVGKRPTHPEGYVELADGEGYKEPTHKSTEPMRYRTPEKTKRKGIDSCENQADWDKGYERISDIEVYASTNLTLAGRPSERPSPWQLLYALPD